MDILYIISEILYKISDILYKIKREKVNFNGFAIFSISGHLGFSTGLNFTSLKPCSLIMLHVKFEIHGCSGFRE